MDCVELARHQASLWRQTHSHAICFETLCKYRGNFSVRHRFKKLFYDSLSHLFFKLNKGYLEVCCENYPLLTFGCVSRDTPLYLFNNQGDKQLVDLTVDSWLPFGWSPMSCYIFCNKDLFGMLCTFLGTWDLLALNMVCKTAHQQLADWRLWQPFFTNWKRFDPQFIPMMHLKPTQSVAYCLMIINYDPQDPMGHAASRDGKTYTILGKRLRQCWEHTPNIVVQIMGSHPHVGQIYGRSTFYYHATKEETSLIALTNPNATTVHVSYGKPHQNIVCTELRRPLLWVTPNNNVCVGQNKRTRVESVLEPFYKSVK